MVVLRSDDVVLSLKPQPQPTTACEPPLAARCLPLHACRWVLLKLVLRRADHGPVVLPQDTCDNCVPVEEGKSWGACITGWGWGFRDNTTSSDL